MEDFSSRLKWTNFDKLVNFLISKNIITEEKYYHMQWDKKGYDDKYDTLLKFLNQLIGANREAVNTYLLDSEKYDLCALTGGFPASPPNYVRRFEKFSCRYKRKFRIIDLESIVEEALLNSDPYTPIVIHGMMGEGKSTLVNGVLSKRKIRKRFDYHIFWISLANIDDNAEEINEKLFRLYLNSVSKTTLSRYLHRPADLTEMKLMISSVFVELRNVLLVIDKVSSSKILNLFQDIICCKVITTRYKSILNPNQSYNLIELSKGFTLEETKNMFRDFELLESQHGFSTFIMRIHNICKGHPQLLTLVLTYIRENKAEALKSDEIWWDAIKKINDGCYEDQIYKAVEMCLDKLKENAEHEKLLQYLKFLVVFKKDANIRPEVLRLLFNTNNIRDIMNHFVKRSLVLSFYNEEAGNFIYMLHEIFWQCLRKTYESEIEYFHKKLIEAYERITNNDFSKLPNDNYSLLYIGYHLEGAKEYSKFTIFLNLDFLESKIKAAGPHDTLADLHRYRNYIVPNEELQLRFESVIKFVECHGANMFQFPQTDIFQYALRDKNKEFHDLALVHAKTNPEKLYLTLNSSNKFHNFRSIFLKDQITAICQVPQSENFWNVFGTANGRIILQIMGKNYIETHHGHAIVELKFTKEYLLSLSSDGRVVIRKLPNNAHLQMPEYKQQDYRHSYKFNNILWTLPAYYENGTKIISAIFTNNFPKTNLICTANEKAEITIWNIKTGNRIKSILERGGSTIRGLCFSMDDIYLIFAHDYQIFFYQNTKKLSMLKQLNLDSVCFEIFHHPYDYHIIAVCENCIYYIKNYTDESKDYKMKFWDGNDEEEKNICAAVSEDFKNIIIGTNQNMIYVFNVTETAHLQLNFKFRSYSPLRSLNLAFDNKECKNSLLLNSTENRVQLCEIDPLQQIPKVINFFVFSSDWKTSEPLSALINPDNKIQIYYSGHIISETETIKETVTATCITIFCNNLIYGLDNGEVWEFNISSRVKTRLFALNGPINYLKCFDISDDDSLNTSADFDSTGSFSRDDDRNIVLIATTKIMTNRERNTIAVYKKLTKNTNIFLFDTNNLFVFYNKNGEFLLIGSNNKLYTWDIHQSQLKHKFEFAGTSEINACALNKKEELLAICTSQKGNKHNLDVIMYNESNVKSKFLVEICDRATCVQFVTETCLIAVGLENGNIEVWKVGCHEPTILKPHCGRVNILYSSPLSGNYPILISAGDVVAFWDLRSLNGNKNDNPPSNSMTDSNQNSMDWFVKKSLKNEYLLSCIKFEAEVKYLSASPDFTKFLIVEHSGNINVMDVIH